MLFVIRCTITKIILEYEINKTNTIKNLFLSWVNRLIRASFKLSSEELLTLSKHSALKSPVMVIFDLLGKNLMLYFGGFRVVWKEFGFA